MLMVRLIFLNCILKFNEKSKFHTRQTKMAFRNSNNSNNSNNFVCGSWTVITLLNNADLIRNTPGLIAILFTKWRVSSKHLPTGIFKKLRDCKIIWSPFSKIKNL